MEHRTTRAQRGGQHLSQGALKERRLSDTRQASGHGPERARRCGFQRTRAPLTAAQRERQGNGPCAAGRAPGAGRTTAATASGSSMDSSLPMPMDGARAMPGDSSPCSCECCSSASSSPLGSACARPAPGQAQARPDRVEIAFKALGVVQRQALRRGAAPRSRQRRGPCRHARPRTGQTTERTQLRTAERQIRCRRRDRPGARQGCTHGSAGRRAQAGRARSEHRARGARTAARGAGAGRHHGHGREVGQAAQPSGGELAHLRRRQRPAAEHRRQEVLHLRGAPARCVRRSSITYTTLKSIAGGHERDRNCARRCRCRQHSCSRTLGSMPIQLDGVAAPMTPPLRRTDITT
jgi:hypothetical protein